MSIAEIADERGALACRVLGDGVRDIAVEGETARAQDDRPGTEVRDGRHVMADKQDGAAVRRDIPHLAQALPLKLQIADREHFVDDQNLAAQMRRHGEGQPHIHAAAVMLHGRVEKALDAGECDDRVELAADLRARHPENRAVEEHVLAPGELLIEAGAHFQKASDAAVEIGLPFGHLRDARQNLQQRALARAVAADQRQRFAAPHVERHVFQRPELLVLHARERMPHAPDNRLSKRRRRGVIVANRVLLADAANGDGEVARRHRQISVRSA